MLYPLSTLKEHLNRPEEYVVEVNGTTWTLSRMQSTGHYIVDGAEGGQESFQMFTQALAFFLLQVGTWRA